MSGRRSHELAQRLGQDRVKTYRKMMEQGLVKEVLELAFKEMFSERELAAIDAALREVDQGKRPSRPAEISNFSKNLKDSEDAAEWKRYAEAMNLAAYAGGVVETPASVPASDLTEPEARAVDVVMAEYTGNTVETPATDLTEQEASFVDALVADFVPHSADRYESGEAERRRLQAALRRVAREIEELEPEEEGSEKHKRLKKRYRELQKRIRELPGGDADREKTYPMEDFSEQEDRGEPQYQPGRFLGMEEFMRIASEDTGQLPEHMRADAELQDALRRQAHAEHFGVDDPNVSDDALYAEYQRIIGEDA